MSGWRDVRLGDVLTLQRGFDLPARDRIEGPFPIVSSSGVTGSHATFKVDPPGVVIGRYGSLGAVHWVEEPFWPLNTSLWVKDFKGNDPRFVSYLLRTVTVDGSTASAVPGVNRNHLHQLPVACPPPATQARIAAVLSAFDELIEINERRIELLEDLARSLYREWFVRLRFPGHEDAKFDDSERGPIPRGWRGADLGSVARWLSGGTPSTEREDFWGGDVPWISSGSLTSMLLDDSDRRLTSAGVEGGTRTVERDAVLFVVRGMSLVREFRVGLAERTLAFGQDVKALVPDRETITPLYLAFTIFDRQPEIQGMAELAGHGTGKLSTDRLKAVRFPLPPTTLQGAFSTAVGPMRELMTLLIARNRHLAATRDLLLPRLVTGRLDISDVDLGALLPAEAA